MKITDISVERYKWRREKPISNGLHTYAWAGVTFVRVETDEGVTGIGLGGRNRVELATVEQLKGRVLGEDPLDNERIWHKMWVPKTIGRRGFTTRAISAIDIALWDIKGKVANMPLYKLLGGFRDWLPTYVAGGYYEEGKGLKELAREMEGYIQDGARAVKMKVGAVPIAEDVQRVKAARSAVGPDAKLMVDANCAYRYYEAIQLARRIEEFDPFWFEEPVQPDDYEGFEKIARATTIPIATGENEYTRYGFRDLVATGAVPILNADAKHLGGVTEFMKVAALAQAHDLDVAPHGAQEVHVHLVAAISNGLILEFYKETFDPMWGRVYHDTLELNDDGTVSPPTAPGLGINPDYEALAEYRVA